MTRIVRPLGLLLLLQSLPLMPGPVAPLPPGDTAALSGSVEPLEDPRVESRSPAEPFLSLAGDVLVPPALSTRILRFDERPPPAARHGDPAHPRRGPPCC